MNLLRRLLSCKSARVSVGQQMQELRQQIHGIDGKLNRMLPQLDFLRTHTSVYLGDDLALTWLFDETPFYVHPRDLGVPALLINGGRYEPENLDVLVSFLRDDTVFLDIRANLGFFAVMVAKYIRQHGRVLAFEPHPRLTQLLRQTADMNVLTNTIAIHQIAVADRDGEVELHYPIEHLASGSANAMEDREHTAIRAKAEALDGLLGEDFTCDLVKIDVEGHEFGALRGMEGIVARSPAIKILFEHLWPTGEEAAMEAWFARQDMELYTVGSEARLRPLEPSALVDWDGYVLATKKGQINDLNRQRLTIWASQLHTSLGPVPSPGGRLEVTAAANELLFHGPYWFLPRGQWLLRLHGIHSRGLLEIAITERFGMLGPVVN